MAGNELTIEGLDELRAVLRNLPSSLAGESTHIVEAAANGAAATIKGRYPVVSGNLRDGLDVVPLYAGKFGAGVKLKNRSRHAWLFDNGSEARHYIEKSGAVHRTGKMWGRRPPSHLFVRSSIQARRQMYRQLKDMVVRKGLIVSGDV